MMGFSGEYGYVCRFQLTVPPMYINQPGQVLSCSSSTFGGWVCEDSGGSPGTAAFKVHVQYFASAHTSPESKVAIVVDSCFEDGKSDQSNERQTASGMEYGMYIGTYIHTCPRNLGTARMWTSGR